MSSLKFLQQRLPFNPRFLKFVQDSQFESKSIAEFNISTNKFPLFRFHSRLVRCLASGTFIVRNLFILGITVYVPCVALNTVVGLHYMVSICFMTVAVILFTLFGGLKAAITADAIQGLIMIIVSMAVIIQGAYDVGGVDNVVQINKDNGELCGAVKTTCTQMTRISFFIAYRPAEILPICWRYYHTCRYTVRLDWTNVYVLKCTGLPAKFGATLFEHEIGQTSSSVSQMVTKCSEIVYPVYALSLEHC